MLKKLLHTFIGELIRYASKKSHDVQIQLLCATCYGLVDLYGLRGSIAIIIKARKLANVKAGNRVTAKSGKVGQ